MKKYKCQICGYIYDDAKEEIKFADLPDDWKCPWCGAPKSMFEEIIEDNGDVFQKKEDEKETMEIEESDDLRQLSNSEIAYICSNLAKSCEKQYLEEEQNLFQQLSDYYEKYVDAKDGTLDDLLTLVNKDIEEFNEAMNIANKLDDRGAKRIITWANKSTNIVKVILTNYKEKGMDYIKNTKIWVCDICGFVYIGDESPQICPVCKVPSLKIMEVN